MNRYLRLFLVTAGLGMFFMGALLAADEGFTGLIIGFGAGLLFGGLFTLALWLIERAMASSRAPGSVPYAGNVKQFRKVIVHLEYNGAFALCRDALAAVPANLKYLDLQRGMIEASTGMSMRSFGEMISVRVGVLGPQQVVVELESRSVIPTALVDFGKSYDNLEKMLQFMSRYAVVNVQANPAQLFPNV